MILTQFKSVNHAYFRPDDVISDTWENIAEELIKFNQVANKDDVKLFNTWQFIDNGEAGRKYHGKTKKTWDYIPGTIRRCKGNALGLWGLMLDFDKNVTIAEVREQLIDVEHVLYTTFSHGPSQDKFRVIAPFDKMMTAEEFDSKSDDIGSLFPNVDPASFSVSQSFYFHCGPDKSKAYAYHNRGLILSPDNFKVNSKPKISTLSLIQQFIATPYSSSDTCILLDELKLHYPLLEYKTRFRVTCAVASSIGSGMAIIEMRNRWPDSNLNGKYENMLSGDLHDDGPTMGTIIFMIRERRPDFKFTPKYKDINLLMQVLERLQK